MRSLPGSGKKEAKIYLFNAKRVKLNPPKTFNRAGKEIVVDSKVVIVGDE